MSPTTDSIIACVGLVFFFVHYMIAMSFINKLKKLDPIVEKCHEKSEFFRNECNSLKKQVKSKIVTELVVKDLILDSTSIFCILKGIYKYKTNDAIKELDSLSFIFSYGAHSVEDAKEINIMSIIIFIICVVGSIYFDSYPFLFISGIGFIAFAILEGEKKQELIYYKNSELFLKKEIIEYGNKAIYYFNAQEPVLISEVIVKKGSNFYPNHFEQSV